MFAWNVCLVSLIFLRRSRVFPILLFSSISLHHWGRLSYLSLLFFRTLHSDVYVFAFLLSIIFFPSNMVFWQGSLRNLPPLMGCCCCWVTSVVSDSVRPHRRQPTMLPRPWDSPGKNTGVGCYILLQCMNVKSESEVALSCPTQRPHGLQPTRLLCPWDSPGKSTGVGCHCLLLFNGLSVICTHSYIHVCV